MEVGIPAHLTCRQLQLNVFVNLASRQSPTTAPPQSPEQKRSHRSAVAAASPRLFSPSRCCLRKTPFHTILLYRT